MKRMLAFVVLILAVFVVWKVVSGGNGQENPEDVTPQLADDAAIYMQDQPLTQEMVAKVVQLTSPGFVVVLESANGSMAGAIGASEILATGKTENVGVRLERVPIEGEMLFAMLYADSNGNGAFDEDADQPLRDKADNRVFSLFMATARAKR